MEDATHLGLTIAVVQVILGGGLSWFGMRKSQTCMLVMGVVRSLGLVNEGVWMIMIGSLWFVVLLVLTCCNKAYELKKDSVPLIHKRTTKRTRRTVLLQSSFYMTGGGQRGVLWRRRRCWWEALPVWWWDDVPTTCGIISGGGAGAVTR